MSEKRSEICEAVQEVVRAEFQELGAKLMEEMSSKWAERFSATVTTEAPAIQVRMSSKNNLNEGDHSPRTDLMLCQPLTNTVRTVNPMTPSGVSSRGGLGEGAAQPAEKPRNFMPIRTYKVSEYAKLMQEVDEAVDQGLPMRKQASSSHVPSNETTPRSGGKVHPFFPTISQALPGGAPQRTPAWQEGPDPAPEAGAAPDEESGPSRALGSTLEVPKAPGSSAAGEEGEAMAPIASLASDGRPRRQRSLSKKHTSAEVALGISPKTRSMSSVPDPDLQLKAGRIVRSIRFELFSTVMVLANAALIGCMSDYMARHLLAEAPLVFRVFDLCFLAFFIFECGLRIYAYRARYLTMWGWGWNLFDLCLVLFQILEEIIMASIGKESAEINMSLSSSFLLRVARILRSVRVLRILHVMRMTEELRLLVSCIVHSLRAFYWAAALIMLMVYVFGVHIVQIALTQRLEDINVKSNAKDPSNQDLGQWYGSVPRAVLSLFQGLTGGVDWNDLVDPLIHQISPWMGVAFFVYISFAILAVMNVVTATFVQQASERGAQVKEIQKVTQASRLFRTLDVNHSGVITFDEIESHLESEEVQEFFRSIDVDLSEARCLFDMLDADKSGSIEFTEFLSGCMRLQGPAKAVDLVLVMRELKEALQAPMATRRQ